MRDTRGDIIRGGVIAGVLGGAFMTLASAVLGGAAYGNEAAESSWTALPRAAAAPFMGSQGAPGFAGITLGLVLHFLVATAWAVAFTFLVRRWTFRNTLLASIPFGLVVWAVMVFGVAPLFDAPVSFARGAPLVSALQHVAFGVVVGLTLVVLQPQNWSTHRTRRRVAA